MTDEPKPPQPLELRDDALAPTIFVDEITGALPTWGDIVVTFARMQSDYSGPKPKVYRQVACRLVISRAALKQGGQWLAEFLAGLEKSTDEPPAAVAKARLN